MKKILFLAMSLVMALAVKAQEDVTSLLSNPDFESDASGWTIVGGNMIAATAANYGYNGTKFIESWVSAPNTLLKPLLLSFPFPSHKKFLPNSRLKSSTDHP